MNSDPPFRSTAIIVDSRGRPVHWVTPAWSACLLRTVRAERFGLLQRQKEQGGAELGLSRVARSIRKLADGPSCTERSEYIC